MNKERRQHKRAFFTIEEKIPITIIKTGKHAKTIAGNILSISSGGIGMVAKRHEVAPIQEADRVIVFSACLPEPVGTVKDIETKVCYFIDFDTYALVAIGCCFTDIPSSLKDKIKRLVQLKSTILET